MRGPSVSGAICIGGGPRVSAAQNEDDIMARISLPQLALAASSITTGGAGGGYTVGARYQLTDALPIAGVRFHWKLANEAAPENVKLSLWAGGSRLATVTVSVASSGVQVATFAAAVNMAAYTSFYVSFYNSTRYTHYTTSTITDPVGLAAAHTGSYSLYFGGVLVYCGTAYASGDAAPTTAAAPGSLVAPIEPITSPER